MSEMMLGEKMLMRILSDPTNKFVRTGSPNIVCTRLPHHWRCNKQLPSVFKVVSLCEAANGTRVTVAAGNEDNHRAKLRNSVAYMRDNMATFDDLRFVGRSGRGKSFHVVITIYSKPMQVAIYKDAIKVTIDGPRQPRNKFNVKRTLSENSSQNSTSSSPHHHADPSIFTNNQIAQQQTTRMHDIESNMQHSDHHDIDQNISRISVCSTTGHAADTNESRIWALALNPQELKQCLLLPTNYSSAFVPVLLTVDSHNDLPSFESA